MELVASSAVQSEAVRTFKEATCIHTRKIYDSCKDKDCIEDLRLYLDIPSQNYIAGAVGVRAKSAELIYIDIDVEPIAYINGHYTVDLRYYYRIFAEAYTVPGRTPDTLVGLAVFDKRVTLCGGPLGSKTFSSQYAYGRPDTQNPMAINMPQAVVEAIDPMILSIKVLEPCDCPQVRYAFDSEGGMLPPQLLAYFPAGININVCEPGRRVFVSIGQFSIIRLERDTQIMVPVYDYCLPDKDCTGIGGAGEDPCELFGLIDFPVSSFFPPTCGPLDVTPIAPIASIPSMVAGASSSGSSCGCVTTTTCETTCDVPLPVKPVSSCGCK
ncbi:MAG: hypothetical protein LBC65_02035 [Oscillospiraceae bacterium]|jgi:hypothetical protein|nr:hypothetical protein [Oscillospiraceae bacterium]